MLKQHCKTCDAVGGYIFCTCGEHKEWVVLTYDINKDIYTEEKTFPYSQLEAARDFHQKFHWTYNPTIQLRGYDGT